MPIFRLKPACKSAIWGGQRLKKEYHKEFDGDTLAETWELSCHPEGSSVIENGLFLPADSGTCALEGGLTALVTRVGTI